MPMKPASAIATLTILTALSACLGDSKFESHPNILILFTDDQRYNTVAALGNGEIHTPTLDRLASMGTAFTRAFVMGGHHGAICAPSRAMLLTGRRLFDLQETGDIIPERHSMMPNVFADAGYTTFATGKWHNNRSAFVRAFQEAEQIAVRDQQSQPQRMRVHREPAAKVGEPSVQQNFALDDDVSFGQSHVHVSEASSLELRHQFRRHLCLYCRLGTARCLQQGCQSRGKFHRYQRRSCLSLYDPQDPWQSETHSCMLTGWFI